MSRKWERMVEKNKQTINTQRKKQGKSILNSAVKEEMVHFRGRSWMLALLFVGFSVFYVIASGGDFSKNSSYNFVIIAYFLFGLFIYFIKRPSLKIGKSSVTSMRFMGPVTVDASNIENILLQPGFVVFQFKQKRSRWVFTRLMQRFDILAMSNKLREFAAHNGVAITDETKGA